MAIILASASPRRKELLYELVKDFKIIPAKGQEIVKQNETPEQTVCRLAEGKCGEVFALHPDDLVIGCDTIVVYNNKILGKPHDAADAERTLRELSGQTHRVLTGVCMQNSRQKLVEFDCSFVQFNNLTDEFIRAYVKGGSPMDKAGSYGIQDGGVVKSYQGSYTNIVGLPVELVRDMLQKMQPW